MPDTKVVYVVSIVVDNYMYLYTRGAILLVWRAKQLLLPYKKRLFHS